MNDATPTQREPRSPSRLSRREWLAVLRRTVREFREDRLTDWAAALTYYAVLALFPALLVFVALVGLFGQYPKTTDALLEIVGKLGPSSAVDTFREPITSVVRDKGGAGAPLQHEHEALAAKGRITDLDQQLEDAKTTRTSK